MRVEGSTPCTGRNPCVGGISLTAKGVFAEWEAGVFDVSALPGVEGLRVGSEGWRVEGGGWMVQS